MKEALDFVSRYVSLKPSVALVLGSGMGGVADAAEGATAVPTSEIPGYPRSTVAGHQGRLVFGMLEGVSVVFVQGRAHLYEGHSIESVTFPIRLVNGLGANRLVVTNAAGGMNPRFRPGTLMFISDHINLVRRNPPVGPRVNGRNAYDPEWIDSAERKAIELGIRTGRGVYVWASGPSYESKAEIAFFRRIGADAVGMSTVPEVIQAAALGMKVLGISTITNPAAGLSKEPLSHEEVLEVGRQVRGDLERLIRAVIPE